MNNRALLTRFFPQMQPLPVMLTMGFWSAHYIYQGSFLPPSFHFSLSPFLSPLISPFAEGWDPVMSFVENSNQFEIPFEWDTMAIVCFSVVLLCVSCCSTVFDIFFSILSSCFETKQRKKIKISQLKGSFISPFFICLRGLRFCSLVSLSLLFHSRQEKTAHPSAFLFRLFPFSLPHLFPLFLPPPSPPPPPPPLPLLG